MVTDRLGGAEVGIASRRPSGVGGCLLGPAVTAVGASLAGVLPLTLVELVQHGADQRVDLGQQGFGVSLELLVRQGLAAAHLDPKYLVLHVSAPEEPESRGFALLLVLVECVHDGGAGGGAVALRLDVDGVAADLVPVRPNGVTAGGRNQSSHILSSVETKNGSL